MKDIYKDNKRAAQALAGHVADVAAHARDTYKTALADGREPPQADAKRLRELVAVLKDLAEVQKDAHSPLCDQYRKPQRETQEAKGGVIEIAAVQEEQ